MLANYLKAVALAIHTGTAPFPTRAFCRPGPAAVGRDRRAGRRSARQSGTGCGTSVVRPRWCPPRLRRKWRKRRIAVATSPVEQERGRPRTPPAPTRRACRSAPGTERVSLDCFPRPTGRLQVLFVLVVQTPARGKVVHFNGTAHPTAQWAAPRLVDAFPWATAPRSRLRDREAIYGDRFHRPISNAGVAQGLAAPRRPGQNAVWDRRIARLRWEGLENGMVVREGHLRRLLTSSTHASHRWGMPL